MPATHHPAHPRPLEARVLQHMTEEDLEVPSIRFAHPRADDGPAEAAVQGGARQGRD
jgi:hypothetical protein